MALPHFTRTRRCGRRKPGGIYLVSAETGPGGILPQFFILNPPVPCADKSHRGPVVVDGFQILTRQPEETWLAGSSAERAATHRAHQYYLDTFGMSLKKRLTTGVCSGQPDADAAIQVLTRTLVYDPRIKGAILNLTKAGLNEVPRSAEHFANLIRNVQDFETMGDVKYLVQSLASLWLIASLTPQRLRPIYTPHVVRAVAYLGVARDAIAIKDTL